MDDRKQSFDFVVFDWKGTLEAKLGTKVLREEEGIKAIATHLKKIDKGEAFLHVYNIKKQVFDKLEKEENKIVTNTAIIESALDELQVNEEEIRQEVVKVFYNIYNQTFTEKKRALYQGILLYLLVFSYIKLDCLYR